MQTTIRTRYATHPGSNVGDILATGAGRRHRRRIDQSTSLEDNHRAAAEALAGRIGVTLSDGEPVSDRNRSGRAYVWSMSAAQWIMRSPQCHDHAHLECAGPSVRTCECSCHSSLSEQGNGVLTIGDWSRSGLYQITDTSWDHNGTLRVTVREMVGVRHLSPNDIRRMRRLARRALMYPEKTRSSRLVRTWFAQGQSHATFAVSRLDSDR